MNNTPLPWRRIHGNMLVDMHDIPVAATVGLDDAELIRVAVNAFPHLLFSLRDITEALDNGRSVESAIENARPTLAVYGQYRPEVCK